MSSISSTSSSTSSMLAAMSGNRVTGMMSGLDTDELVKNMSATTRSKIATTQQKKTTAEWEQEALRSITTLLQEFQNKYTSYSSATNLRSSSFFGLNNITAAGTYSQFVTATGSGNNAGTASLVAVHQLATNASYISQRVSDTALTGTEAVSGSVTTYALAGQKITFQYGKEEYSITLDADAKLDSMEAVKTEIEKQLETVEVGRDKTLKDVVQVSASNADVTLSIAKASGDGTDLRIKSMGSGFKDVFGEEIVNKLTDEDYRVTDNAEVMTKTGDLSKTFDLTDYLVGKSFTFNYNGESKTIKLSDDELAKIKIEKDVDGNVTSITGVADAFQSALDKAFGAGRIQVDTADGKLSFKTMDVTTGNEDNFSTLKLTGGDAVALKALGLESGMSNRINTSDTITGSELYVNDIKVEFSEEALEDGLTYTEVMNAINNGDYGVKVSYLETTGQWSIQSTHSGAAGEIKLTGDIATSMFGKEIGEGDYTKGQDAIVSVDYGTGEPVQVTRSSNTFDLNGMKVTVSGTFNSKTNDDGSYAVENENEGVKFNASANTEKITTAVKEMVEAYNAIIKLANDMVREKPDRNYKALSEDQKEDMEDDEIEDWTKKARAGILFGDSDLRMFTDDISTLFAGSGEIIKALEDMGITTSSNYADNGKLVFDEEKFKAAVEADPSKVEEIFAGDNGIMNGVKKVFDEYGKTEGASKGIFVKRAGHESSALSMLDNSIQKEIDEYDDLIEKLKEKLEKEVEKYYNMFASLETYISNMNAQSSMFMSMGS